MVKYILCTTPNSPTSVLQKQTASRDEKDREDKRLPFQEKKIKTTGLQSCDGHVHTD